MWGYLALGGITAVGIGYDYFFGSRTEPEPVSDGTAGLLKLSLILGVAVSGITLYQFWRAR